MNKTIFFIITAFFFTPNTEGSFEGTWQKGPTERFTSLAVDQSVERVYVTYTDLTKEEGVNGKVKSINTAGKTPTPELQILQLPTDIATPLSPISIRTDSCNNMWILDSGVQNLSGIQVKTSQPSIQSFNLQWNKHKSGTHYKIPVDMLTTESFLTSMAVETPGKCEDSTVYIADFNRPALIVYYSKKNISRLIEHFYFSPDPLQTAVPSEMIFNKKQRDINGIFGLTVAENKLFFHPLASLHEFNIDLELVRSYSTKINFTDISIAFDRPRLSGASAYDPKTKVLFYAEFKGIGCVGEASIYNQVKTPKLKNKISSAYITDLAVNGSSLWVLTNSNDNFSIVEMNILKLINNTVCDVLNDQPKNRIDSNHLYESASKKTSVAFPITVMGLLAIIVNLF